MTIIEEIEALEAPCPDVDRRVAHLFGRKVRPAILCQTAHVNYVPRRISSGDVADRFTSSLDAVLSLVVGDRFLGSLVWTTTGEGEPLAIANFRGKPGRAHNAACAMLAAMIRFYMPELDHTHAAAC